ncbi:TrbI/VirB10 family protein [Janthinobacterium sp. CG3]|uniref:TrbI/VirB10 family protein n=1 Tax=Janthinobacterium sp. CG3 TaxID=1075768 RepID=UPI00034689E0|nr:TrbI/VirB10 family protein [Janthinobacterium sp. CG3]
MTTTTEDEMSPDASPGEHSNKRSGVRRVNNVPLYLLGAGLGVFLLIMILVASDRAAKQNEPMQAVEHKKAGDTNNFAKEIAGNQKDGIVQAKAKPLVVSDLNAPPGSVAVARPANLDLPPTPPPGAASMQPPSSQQQMTQQQRSPVDEQAERIRQMKEQLLLEAIRAKSGVAYAPPRSAGSSLGSVGSSALGSLGSAPATREEALQRIAAVRQQLDAAARDDPTAAYKARLQQLQAAGIVPAGASAGQGGGGLGGGPPKLVQTSAGRNDVGQFAGSGQGDRWRLESEPEAPRSPYELRAGFVIPGLLISGINSELPGQIMAQVSQDVYDTPLGKYKLIPQGSRLVGSYTSDVAFGQSRILIGWQRIVFPDGKAMDIGSMPGSDSAGYAGLKDKVNNHYFRLFGSAFLMSAVTAGVAMSQPDQAPTNNRPTASSAVSEALGQQLGNVTAQLISKNLNVAPTLEIRPGYRFNVIVTKDMTFSKPYKAFDY